MKSNKKTGPLLAALICISMAVAGCGKSGDTQGTTGGAPSPGSVMPGLPGYGGAVMQPLPGGGTQIGFSGLGVYDSGVRISGYTPGYMPNLPPTSQTLTLGTANPLGGMPGQPGTLVGPSDFFPGSSVNIIKTPTQSQFASNITGVIVLSPQFIQMSFGGVLPQILGLYIDLYVSGSQIYGGKVYFCTSKDQMGSCHGAYLEI